MKKKKAPVGTYPWTDTKEKPSKMTKAVMVWFLIMMAKLPLQKVISELLFLLPLYVILLTYGDDFVLQ